MKVILITPPQTIKSEPVVVNKMFADGLKILHLRKPDATTLEMEKYILQIEEKYRDRVILHSSFELIARFNLMGAHIGVNRSLSIVGYNKHLSYSCHSLHEVVIQKSRCDYVFLSPIFDSISKQGYSSTFTDEELFNAKKNGIIDNKVIALGGVTLTKIEFVKRLGFGGIAILGDVWQNPNPIKRLHDYLNIIQ